VALLPGLALELDPKHVGEVLAQAVGGRALDAAPRPRHKALHPRTSQVTSRKSQVEGNLSHVTSPTSHVMWAGLAVLSSPAATSESADMSTDCVPQLW